MAVFRQAQMCGMWCQTRLWYHTAHMQAFLTLLRCSMVGQRWFDPGDPSVKKNPHQKNKAGQHIWKQCSPPKTRARLARATLAASYAPRCRSTADAAPQGLQGPR